MRPIDADIFKKELVKEINDYGEFIRDKVWEYEGGVREGYIETLKKLNEQPTVDEWIPCDKKLPKESGTYLVTIQYGENRIQQVKKFSDDLYHVDEFDFGEYKNKKHCGWYDYDSEWGFCEIDNVIAWKPLGEEYKRE